MTFTVPIPVSTNRMWRTFRGRVVVSPAARAYKETVARTALAAGVRPIRTGDVAVTVHLYGGRRGNRLDVDNMKVLLDAMNGIAYADDAQVSEFTSRRFAARDGEARAEVTVRAAGKA